MLRVFIKLQAGKILQEHCPCARDKFHACSQPTQNQSPLALPEREVQKMFLVSSYIYFIGIGTKRAQAAMLPSWPCPFKVLNELLEFIVSNFSNILWQTKLRILAMARNYDWILAYTTIKWGKSVSVLPVVVIWANLYRFIHLPKCCVLKSMSHLSYYC